MNRRDREAWLDCFADDARQEDPVGTPPNVGREGIGRFFDAIVELPFTVEVTGDPIVVGDEVMAFLEAVTEADGHKARVRIVDHIVLSADGTRFQSMRAFFNPDDFVPEDGAGEG